MRKLLGMLLAMLLGWSLAQTDHAGHGGMTMQAMAELQKLQGRDFDIAYISMMIDHHKGAVEMAQAILKVSKDARIRKAAQEIIALQNKEITQLTNWLRSWYGVAPSQRYMAMMRADMQAMMDTALMGMMPGHGSSPDRAFLEGMIPHHQEAVEMSRLCLQKAARAELKRFCHGVISVQSREIEQYRQWLKNLP